MPISLGVEDVMLVLIPGWMRLYMKRCNTCQSYGQCGRIRTTAKAGTGVPVWHEFLHMTQRTNLQHSIPPMHCG
jgi:hypothetical protein